MTHPAATTCPACDREQPDGLLCHYCCEVLERELGDVPAIVAELDITLSKQARIGNASGPSGLARERAPINVGAMNVAADLQNTLTTWARDVAEVGFLAVHSTSPARAGARILLNHVPEIRRHPAVVELLDEITDAIRQARRVVDRPMDLQFVGPCLAEFEGVTCTEDIYARPGASHATCKVCGITHEVAERRAWLLTEAQDMIVTVKDASRYLGEVGDIRVTEASIRGYLHRGKIAYRAPVEAKRIRLGDLLSVVLDEGERRTA